MTPRQIAKLAAVYADRDTDTHRSVHQAVSAVLEGTCANPVVVTGVRNLLAHFEQKADLPDVERAERYLCECWAEQIGGIS